MILFGTIMDNKYFFYFTVYGTMKVCRSYGSTFLAIVTSSIIEHCITQACIMEHCIMQDCVMEHCIMQTCIMKHCTMQRCIKEHATRETKPRAICLEAC